MVTASDSWSALAEAVDDDLEAIAAVENVHEKV